MKKEQQKTVSFLPDKEEEKCSTCGKSYKSEDAIFCSNSFHLPRKSELKEDVGEEKGELTVDWLTKNTDNHSTDGCWVFYIPISHGRIVIAGLKKNNGFSLNEIHGFDNDGDYTNIVTIPEIKTIQQFKQLYSGLEQKEFLPNPPKA